MTAPEPDRLDALLEAACAADEELAALRAVIATLRTDDIAENVSIDVAASWRRIEQWLDTS